MNHHRKLSLFVFLLLPVLAFAQVKPAASFRIVPLGVLGGADESNLSAYMLAPKGSDSYICLDAGTIHTGIAKAIAAHSFSITAEQVLKKYIKGYFISHAHLDHVAGLIMNSPDDSTKNIYGLQSTLQTIKTHYFTWDNWANFADNGEVPQLKKYHYKTLEPGVETGIENTGMQVKVFPLSHANLTSTAFLVRSKDSYVLYLGDTGADEIEKSQNLHNLWAAVAPLVKARKLKAIMIEVSFPNEQPDKSLFGHLTPRLLMNEMAVLGKLTGASLKGLNIVVTHLKPPYKSIVMIKTQLKAANKLQLNLIYPQQGKALEL
ncbi:3',5'-cyclic-nucleotide phosphodiesterase [Mucilaginibacter terrigena]|uniref:3',5'-cyclic-nucleotide phosphodiesterase n=1 Tax=Mucilaginibacter terrigena TaxID=2492395 RepID=A0A4Q5LKB4_9SPHI|nr:3',5'-cyclic-nucleotide phosphodiesterase [Mucilaginibacter terrigena]RYU90101.1 3',5'-cyclic-nucleotide phosphodiesterase [Mucilaginibacter terrigena]